MREVSRTDKVIHSACTVVSGAGSPVPTTPHGPPHMFPER